MPDPAADKLIAEITAQLGPLVVDQTKIQLRKERRLVAWLVPSWLILWIFQLAVEAFVRWLADRWAAQDPMVLLRRIERETEPERVSMLSRFNQGLYKP